MIQDFDDAQDRTTFSADLCIVGAGAAGIGIALEFLGGHCSVLLIEGGGLEHELGSQQLYNSAVVGLPHLSIQQGRARVFGGTTTLWAGQASAFEAIDFRRRDWVAYSGWPIDRQELEPYFLRVAKLMNLSTVSCVAAVRPPRNRPLPAYDESKLRLVTSQFSPSPNFAVTYGPLLQRARNIRVLLHANAVSVVSNSDATTVDRVEIKSLSGRSGSVRARYFVICCGAIETARLLLASNSVEPYGLGNRHDVVGRFFQDHLHCTAAVIVPHDDRLRAMHAPYYTGSVKRLTKIAASDALQERECILNVATEIISDVPEDSAVAAAKLLLRARRRRDLRSQMPAALKNVVLRPHALAAAGYRHFVRKGTLTAFDGTLRVGVQSESDPNPSSRVRLGDDVDALGMRRTVLDWRLTQLDGRTIEVFVRTVAAEFERLGLGVVDLKTFGLLGLPDRLDQSVRDATHHMGTTRMHDDRRLGVVDRNCRIHGIDNLYVGSTAVLPTGSFSNPTFNALALCLRLADRLKERLGMASRDQPSIPSVRG